MDIIKQAEEEIRIFERPSVETSKALMVEVESLRREVERLKIDAMNRKSINGDR